MQRYVVDGVEQGEVAKQLRTGDGRVRLEVPEGYQQSRCLHLSSLAEGAVLEVMWLGKGSSTACSVRLQGGQLPRKPTGGGVTTITVVGAGRRQVVIDGPISLAELRAAGASVRLSGGHQSVQKLRLERGAGVRGCYMCGATVEAAEGDGVVRQEGGELVLDRAMRLEVSVPNIASSPIVNVADAAQCEMRHLKLRLAAGGRMVECRGSVRLVSCVDAFVTGQADSPLVIGAAFEPAPDGDNDLLRNSVLMRVALEGETLSAFLSAAVQASLVDPLPSTVKASLETVPEDVREGVAELMLQRLSEKAPRPQAVDVAAAVVLELRRRNVSPWTADWLLLEGFRALGYGRVVGPPMVLWLLGVGIILGIRAWQALERDNGLISSAGIAPTATLGEIFSYAGDVLLTASLLPLSWLRGNETAEVIGLSGGYLVGARVFLAVPVLFMIGAARSRLRVRPAALSQ